MSRGWKLVPLAAVAALAGCVTAPTGPQVTALPGTSKSFDQFQADDASCRQYAQYSIGGADATQQANNAGATNAVIGAGLGAAAGAVVRTAEAGAAARTEAGTAEGGMAAAGMAAGTGATGMEAP